jgi:hypothetical protein
MYCVAGQWLPFRRPLEVGARGKGPARPTHRPPLSILYLPEYELRLPQSTTSLSPCLKLQFVRNNLYWMSLTLCTTHFLDVEVDKILVLYLGKYGIQ